MNCIYRGRLDAFHDGELSAAAASELQRHVETCAACAEELANIREVSRSFGGMAREEPSGVVLARAHRAADSFAVEAASPVPRVAAMLSGLAASVLVIASAWLWETPADPGRPAPARVTMPSPAEEWERVAMTLESDPVPGDAPEMPGRPTLADARCADWMLRHLVNGAAGGR